MNEEVEKKIVVIVKKNIYNYIYNFDFRHFSSKYYYPS